MAWPGRPGRRVVPVSPAELASTIATRHSSAPGQPRDRHRDLGVLRPPRPAAAARGDPGRRPSLSEREREASAYVRSRIRAWVIGERFQPDLGGELVITHLIRHGRCSQWGGWGSNPRPADYENYGPAHRKHYLHGY